MPKGTSDSKITNKTEFMRYLNDNEVSVPSLLGIQSKYRKLNLRGYNFGVFARSKHYPKFAEAYTNYWLKHPELYNQKQTA